ncbi:hypothetical protein Gasu2_04400 [Galdieria sulphuraria]|nr:hypothetical protein Gasu2_04400 [Galdieria sulphuraria]
MYIEISSFLDVKDEDLTDVGSTNDHTVDESQDEEQLPSWEDLANIQFSISFNPKDYAKPFFYGGLGLFTVGLAAGTVVSGVTKPPPPPTTTTKERTPEMMLAARAEGFRLASKALLYGTCLCGMFAVVGVYTIHKVAHVNSVEEWVEKLKVWVPQKRATMEQKLQPVLDRIRDTGNSTIPSQWQSWQRWFHDASFGKWLDSIQ